MPKITYFIECVKWIDLEFVDREGTSCEILKNGIHNHLSGLSFSSIVILVKELGVDQSRVAILSWVQKADLQPVDSKNPDCVAVDQEAIRINDE
jgi:transposase-like protein